VARGSGGSGVDERGRGETGMGRQSVLFLKQSARWRGMREGKRGVGVGPSSWRREKERGGLAQRWAALRRVSRVVAHAGGGDRLPNRGRRWGAGDMVRVRPHMKKLHISKGEKKKKDEIYKLLGEILSKERKKITFSYSVKSDVLPHPYPHIIYICTTFYSLTFPFLTPIHYTILHQP
jgi:hypothetical protein